MSEPTYDDLGDIDKIIDNLNRIDEALERITGLSRAEITELNDMEARCE